MLQSIVLNIMFLSLTCSSHKERLKIEKLWGFGLFLFKKLRNITAPVFFLLLLYSLERVHWLFQ